MKIRHFDASGQEYWSASLTTNYQVKGMLADGNQVVMVSEYPSTQDVLVTVLGGLNSADHTTTPSS